MAIMLISDSEMKRLQLRLTKELYLCDKAVNVKGPKND